MKKEFVNYEQALALKELGLDLEPESIFAFYYNNELLFADGYENWYLPHDGDIAAPLYQQAFRFFREKYGLWFYPLIYNRMITYDIHQRWDNFKYGQKLFNGDNYSNYEDAQDACLNKFIELVQSESVIELTRIASES